MYRKAVDLLLFVPRTAKASADEIGRDMEYLWRTWQTCVAKRFGGG